MPTIYVTAPPEAAESLAQSLLDDRLAACVNMVEGRSLYRWEGAVVDEPETILLAKTTDGAADALVERIRTEHPHEVLCIERFDESAVLPSFARWRDEVVAPD